MRGRKHKQESRSTEFRWKLFAWKQIPESSRPSLRALACELGTSHQLLGHYLDGLDEWECKEHYRNAKKSSEGIRARANAESRLMTGQEVEQVHAHDDAAFHGLLSSMLVGSLADLKREAKRGQLNRHQIKMLKMLARNDFPGAQELLQKCLLNGIKKRKRFSEIVRETPRQEGETGVAWVRRIWDKCDNYDTKCPAVITEELLEKCSRSRANKQKNNLPAFSADAAKSFRTVQGKAKKDWQLR